MASPNAAASFLLTEVLVICWLIPPSMYHSAVNIVIELIPLMNMTVATPYWDIAASHWYLSKHPLMKTPEQRLDFPSPNPNTATSPQFSIPISISCTWLVERHHKKLDSVDRLRPLHSSPVVDHDTDYPWRAFIILANTPMLYLSLSLTWPKQMDGGLPQRPVPLTPPQHDKFAIISYM